MFSLLTEIGRAKITHSEARIIYLHILIFTRNTKTRYMDISIHIKINYVIWCAATLASSAERERERPDACARAHAGERRSGSIAGSNTRESREPWLVMNMVVIRKVATRGNRKNLVIVDVEIITITYKWTLFYYWFTKTSGSLNFCRRNESLALIYI